MGFYLGTDRREGDILLCSVKDCENAGVMDTLARREMWMSAKDVFQALKQHWTTGVRYDVAHNLHLSLNTCIPNYRAGTLT